MKDTNLAQNVREHAALEGSGLTRVIFVLLETLNSSASVLAPKQVQALIAVPVLECPSQLMGHAEMAALTMNLGDTRHMKEISAYDCLFLK